jgi:outer membrane murein-binding lipoprotein Lpp
MDRRCGFPYIQPMAQMVSEVYDALRSVNVPEDKARKAAEALAVPDMGKVDDARFDRIDSEIADLKADVAGLKIDVAALKTDVASLKTDIALIKLMLGFVVAMNAAILARLLFVQ